MEAEDEIDSITESMDMNLSKLWKIVENRGDCYVVFHGVTKIWTQLRDQTTILIEALFTNQDIETTKMPKTD